MAQVESSSDLATKGGGGAKKQAPQGKPTRQEIDKKIKELKVVQSDLSDDVLERALEKNNYDTNNTMDYLLDGKQSTAEWQTVSRNKKEETKTKPADKRNGHEGGSGEKSKGDNNKDYDKRNDRDDKGSRPNDRKPKKPDARFTPKQEGGSEVAADAHRGPVFRGDRDSKQNGSPSNQSRAPRRQSGPVGAQGPKPSFPQQQSQQHPPQSTPPPQHSTSHAQGSTTSAWGNPHAAQAAHTQPPSTSLATQQPAAQSPAPAPAAPAPSPATSSRPVQSYLTIAKGQQNPPPQQTPPPSQQPSSGAAASSTSSNAPQQPGAGSRQHSARASPTNPTWRPKDTSTSSLPTSASTAQTTPSATTTTPSAAPTSVPAATAPSAPAVSAPQPTQAHAPSQPLATQAQTPAPAQQPQTLPQAAPAPQPVVQSQPAPISPPSSVSSQPKRQSVVIDGVHLPPSLKFASNSNLSFQFGSMGFDSKSKDSSSFFGTQPTSTPAAQAPISQQPTQPIHAPAHPTSTTPPPSQQSHVQQPATAHHTAAHPAQTQHTAASAQHTQHAAPAQQPAHPTHTTHPSHAQHVPSHLSQQPLHLNGDHANMGGHLQADEMHQMQAAYPYGVPGYFHMPTNFGFSENPDDALRRGAYYDHPTTPGYAGAPDNSSSPSSVPQNSQSPPPQNPSQYQPYFYPPYGMHPYYQASAPGHSQFQQYPAYNMYGYGSRMTGYPPVHPSGSPASQSHSQYEDSDTYKGYLPQQGSYQNFYNSSGSAGSGTAGSTQGSQQTGSSVSKPAQSFSPSATPTEGVSGKQDYKSSYGGSAAHRGEPSSFSSYNMSQPGSFQNQHQPFMQQHLPQNIPQSSGYHHSAPLSQTTAGQSGGARSHYTGLS